MTDSRSHANRWRRIVERLALEMHTAIERLPPQELRAFGFETLRRWTKAVASESEKLGTSLSAERIDDIVTAAFEEALSLAKSLPPTGQAS